MSGYFIEFERGDVVRLKGDPVTYTVLEVDLRGYAQYRPNDAEAVIVGNGMSVRVSCSELEIAS